MKAFPVPRYVNSDGETWDSAIQGMDLRDYFAAKAMQAIISRSDFQFDNFSWKTAYEAADAMLKAREK